MQIEEIKTILKMCNQYCYNSWKGKPSWADKYYDFLAPIQPLCSGVCEECTTRAVLKYLFPELEDFTEEITEEEFLQYAKDSGIEVKLVDDVYGS